MHHLLVDIMDMIGGDTRACLENEAPSVSLHLCQLASDLNFRHQPQMC